MTMDTITILAIDDEIDFTSALSRRLGRRGYTVRMAPGGEQGLDLLGQDAFDVVLLDVTMAGPDGLKVLGQIRKRHPDVEVVMLTAHVNSDLVISSLAMGAYDYLVKPVNLKELVRTIDGAVTRRRERLVREGT